MSDKNEIAELLEASRAVISDHQNELEVSHVMPDGLVHDVRIREELMGYRMLISGIDKALAALQAEPSDPDAVDLDSQLRHFWGSCYWTNHLRNNPALSDETKNYLLAKASEVDRLRADALQAEPVEEIRELLIDDALSHVKQDYDTPSVLSTSPEHYVENAIAQLIDAGYRLQPAKEAEPVKVMAEEGIYTYSVNSDGYCTRIAIEDEDGETIETIFRAPPQPAKVPEGITAKRLAEAMQYVWNDHCGDTGCIPVDFEIKGPRTTQVYADFIGGDFANQVFRWLTAAPTVGKGEH